MIACLYSDGNKIIWKEKITMLKRVGGCYSNGFSRQEEWEQGGGA